MPLTMVKNLGKISPWQHRAQRRTRGQKEEGRMGEMLQSAETL